MAGIHWSDQASREPPAVVDRGSITIEQSAFRQYGGIVFGFSGSIIFLLVGLVFASQAPIALIGFWFFAIVMFLGAVVYARRGSDRRLIEVGPDGIWLPEMGLLAWTEIREVRLETIRAVGEGDRVVLRRRLGVEPDDPERRPSVTMRIGWGLFDAYSRFVKSMAPGMRFGGEDRAPFGFGEPEATPAQVDDALAVVRGYVDVVDADEERARERAPRWAARGAEMSAGTTDLRALDAHIGADAATPMPVTASFVPVAPQRAPSGTFRTPPLSAAASWGWLLGAIPSLGFLAYIFGAVEGHLQGFNLIVFLLVAAGFLGPIAVRFVPRTLEALRRSRLSDAERTVLQVGPDGIWLPGMGTVAWEAVRSVRTRVSGTTLVGITGRIPRWGLYVQADPGREGRGASAVFADQLDAPFDDVVDLIRHYHRVEEAGEAVGADALRERRAKAPALIGPVMLAMAVAFLALTLLGWSKSTALAERGVTAPGTVIAKTVSSGDGHEYRLRYEFGSLDGVRQTSVGSVSAEMFATTAVGDAVTVTYLPEDPGTNVLGRASTPYGIVLWGALALELVFLIVAGALTFGTLRRWSRRPS
jgi:hypothetical protein